MRLALTDVAPAYDNVKERRPIHPLEIAHDAAAVA